MIKFSDAYCRRHVPSLHLCRQIKLGCDALLELFQSSLKSVHFRTHVQGRKFEVEAALVGILHVRSGAGVCHTYRGIAGGG